MFHYQFANTSICCLASTRDTIRNALGDAARKDEPVKGAPMRVTRQSGDLQRLVNEVKGQVKKIGITGTVSQDNISLISNALDKRMIAFQLYIMRCF